MCLSVEQFAQFLNLIGAEMVTSAPAQVTIHATTGDVIWVLQGIAWCLV